jgi:hypothetical protein
LAINGGFAGREITMRSPHANRGRSLEITVLTSQRRDICVAKIPNGVRYIGGENLALPSGKNRWVPRYIPAQSPCDFMGCVLRTGQAIAFETKKCALVRAFRVDSKEFPRHQREFLCRMGSAGAVAGAVVEAVAVGRFLWLDWRYFTPRSGTPWPTIPWTDPAWFDLGPSTGLIQFSELVASEWVEDDKNIPRIQMNFNPAQREGMNNEP